jgi:hypothetical protein
VSDTVLAETIILIFQAILAGALGFIFVTIIDRVWYEIDYKKAEKGLEVLEHYHYGIGLFAVSFLFVEHIPVLAVGLLGMGAAFIYHESKQKNYFSVTSTHFKSSLAIALGLCAIAIFAYLYLLTPLG